MRLSKLSLPLLALATAPALPAQDLTISEIGRYQGNDDYVLYGVDQGIAAYSFATTACNVGTSPVDWYGTQMLAPILGKNVFRIVDGRIEHIGYSFVKFGGCSTDDDQPTCPGTCQPTNGDCSLGVSCADVYWASLNDGKFGGGKWEIDPVTAVWPAGTPTGPTGNPLLRGRVQVEVTDFADPNAVYVVEAQYLAADDHAAGLARNDYGWREVAVDGAYAMSNAGPTVLGEPAIYAWQAYANDVQIVETPVIDEGGPGVHGWIFVGSRAIDLGGGQWGYEYAVQNGNSDRAVGTFAVDVPCDGGFQLSADHYRGTRHHSGSPYSNADWTFSHPSGVALWRTVTYQVDPAAAAVHWGELASFGFTCNRPPAQGQATLGLFKPGTPTSLSVAVVVPGGDFPGYCTANANSTGVAAVLAASGSPWVEHASLRMDVTSLPTSSFGYFLMSQSTTFVPLFGGSQGNLCVGAPQLRFSKDVLNSGGSGEVSFDVDFGALPSGVQFMPGDVWHWQYWYRDVNPTPTSNTTAGVTVSFCQ